MIDTFKKVWDLLNRQERKKVILLFAMILCMGLTEAVGIASIMPFISVASNPEVIHQNTYLSFFYQYFNFTRDRDFLVALGCFVFFLVVGGLTFKSLTYWAMIRFTQMRNYSISSRLLGGYLNRDYSWFLNKHSADLGKTIITEVLMVVNNALIPGVNFLANTVVSLAIITLLILVNPIVSICAALFIGGAYGFTYFLARKKLTRLGIERGIANQERFRVAQESLGGIKDLKVLGLEYGYLKAFKSPALQFSRSQAKNLIIGQMPRFVLEALVFGGMIILLLVLLSYREGNLETLLPLMALYAFAASRLIPALQQVYQALAKLRYGKSTLNELHHDMKEVGLIDALDSNTLNRPTANTLKLKESLQLKEVSYTYPQAEQSALAHLNLTIESNTTVALVGGSGAGKTTAIDIILGLLPPESGAVVIDGKTLERDDVRAWQNNLGYVPQSIFLTDDTLKANIAFGVRKEEIDHDAVVKAAQAAGLHDYIQNELPSKYDTMVGERGVRLSGGQRQRVGIARALYSDPDVLIFDEATSALDNITEKHVMDSIQNIGRRKTIILIAHRLSTVMKCDNLFYMENGSLISSGSYEELIQKCPSFKRLAFPE